MTSESLVKYQNVLFTQLFVVVEWCHLICFLIPLSFQCEVFHVPNKTATEPNLAKQGKSLSFFYLYTKINHEFCHVVFFCYHRALRVNKKTLAFVLNILFCRFYPAEAICLMRNEMNQTMSTSFPAEGAWHLSKTNSPSRCIFKYFLN